MFEREEMDEEVERPSTNPKRQSGEEMVSSPALDRAVANFAACVRCSYFWGGYRVIVGEEAAEAAVAETAVNESTDGWLTLIWNQAVCKLVHKSYGVLVDDGFYHYEGTCPECRRPYICATDSETADTPLQFHIQLSRQ
jgi:hypothetical protein